MADFGPDHVTTEHYTAFGMIVHICSHLDSLIEQIVLTMIGASPPAIPLMSLLSTKDKRDYVSAMAKVSALPPYAIKGLEKLMERAKSAFDTRNDVAHCVWAPGRRPGSLKPMTLSARGRVKIGGSGHNERDWTAQELIEEARRIHDLGSEIALFMGRYGLAPPWLRERPPSPSPHRPKTGKPRRAT